MNLGSLILASGYLGIFLALFAESGFFLGFFLPGDSLLFTLGILSASGHFNIWIIGLVSVVGAILGDSFGYWTGSRFGRPLFSNPRFQWIVKPSYITRTEKFFTTYGAKTIILSRFIPIVRTFTPILAGVGKMRYKTFLIYNAVGGILWTGGFLTISYFLGKQFPGIGSSLSLVVLGIVIISLIPVLFHIRKSRRESVVK